eukprot:TRINITY_DN44434_c0_g1_i1.p1 TRINITY_DN44434_c0_g1~~TRINITY_DN44434_c0_g1_i1.p1  ORF type:complete len:293 (+),score=75.09 TRINITY_DN44434_c0_g1_i1:60-938(+)
MDQQYFDLCKKLDEEQNNHLNPNLLTFELRRGGEKANWSEYSNFYINKYPALLDIVCPIKCDNGLYSFRVMFEGKIHAKESINERSILVYRELMLFSWGIGSYYSLVEHIFPFKRRGKKKLYTIDKTINGERYVKRSSSINAIREKQQEFGKNLSGCTDFLSVWPIGAIKYDLKVNGEYWGAQADVPTADEILYGVYLNDEAVRKAVGLPFYGDDDDDKDFSPIIDEWIAEMIVRIANGEEAIPKPDVLVKMERDLGYNEATDFSKQLHLFGDGDAEYFRFKLASSRDEKCY